MPNLTIPQFQKELAKNSKQFESVLPSHIPPAKFMRTVVGAIQNNPDILQCDQSSILLACQKAAQDGLIVDNREAALVAYNKKQGSNWVKHCQYQPMVAGVLKKLRNSNKLSAINALIVHKNDPFKYNPATDDLPDHAPDWFGDRGEMVGVYAFAKLNDGSTQVEILTLSDIEKIRRVSKSGNDKQTGKPKGIWAEWYEEKAKVAAIKRLCKRLPSSADIDIMFDHDNEDYHTPHESQENEDNISEMIIEAEATEINKETGEIKQ